MLKSEAPSATLEATFLQRPTPVDEPELVNSTTRTAQTTKATQTSGLSLRKTGRGERI